MTFKPGQLVMKVRHPINGEGQVPLHSIGEYIRHDPSRSQRGFVHSCHWPCMKGHPKDAENCCRWWMQDGTIIPLNDPNFKGEDTDADVHSRRPIKETA